MPTPAELRALAEATEKEAETLAAEITSLSASLAMARHQVVELRKLADLAEKRGGLRPIGAKSTTSTKRMEARPASRGSRVSAANTKGQWPFHQALAIRNLSIPMWAAEQEKQGHPVSSSLSASIEAVRSWLKKPGKGGRPCPMEWAKRIEAEFPGEVPAVAASWPNGIRPLRAAD